MTYAYVALFYILGLPIALRLLCVAHTKLIIQRKAAKMPKSRSAAADLPSPIWPKLKERLAFSKKDTRKFSLKAGSETNLENRKVLLIIWAVGLGISLVGVPLGRLGYSLLAGTIVFGAVIGLAVVKANGILKTRQSLVAKMFEIARSTLGAPPEAAANPGSVVQVLEWDELVKPMKVQMSIPTTFSSSGEENFLRQYNQVFGMESAWIAFNDPETKKLGWNYEDGVLTIAAQPPLPSQAPWEAHYVLDPTVSWSFFPIAIGIEDGIEVVNPKTGQTENVLGFDLSGLQAGISKDNGTYSSPKLGSASPMVLIGGGTGGGKALDINTKIKRVKK